MIFFRNEASFKFCGYLLEAMENSFFFLSNFVISSKWQSYILKQQWCLSICLFVVTNRAGQGQGRAARADTCPLDLLAARSNRLRGLLAVQTSNLHPNKNIYNKKTRIFLKKKIETK
jgi:hypothetical protein